MKTEFFYEPAELDYTGFDIIENADGDFRKYFYKGQRLYSLSKVLAIRSEEGIKKWRERVGEEEADKISYVASEHGKNVHAIVEDYLKNDPDWRKGTLPSARESFLGIKNTLDTRLGIIEGIEVSLCSKSLMVAGRADLVAEFDGKPSIIDIKTSARRKPKKFLENYFLQKTAYSIMWEELTGVGIQQLVTLIAVGDGQPQIEIEDSRNWSDMLLETIDEYAARETVRACVRNLLENQ